MMNKTRSILLIFFIYAIGAVGASFLFLNLPFDIIVSLLIADIGYTLFIYLLSLVLKNASLYDPYGSVVPPLMLILVAIYIAQPLFMGVLCFLFGIGFWSIRLTFNAPLTRLTVLATL